MSNLVTASVAATIMLFSISVQACASDASTFFRSDYPSAVSAMRENAMNQSVKLELHKIDGGKSSLFKTIEYKANGENRLVTFRFTKEDHTKVFVYGPTKIFRLNARDGGGFDAMKAGVRGDNDEGLTSIAEYIYCPFAPFGSSSLLELEELGDITITSVTKAQDEINVDYSYNREGKAIRKCTTKLDPERGWVATVHAMYTMDGTLERKRAIEYSVVAESDLVGLSKISELSLEGKKIAKYETQVMSLDRRPAPIEVFSLAYYGLPESLGDPPSRGWRRVMAFLLVALVGGAYAYRRLTRAN
ncbi:hypothetical protein [Rhodopirellula bahusiensis]|uniref:hypothetical protein n=1 Tax=Rhodopirellula bahusiensis TaxID=2014065 RepID=UPI003267C6CD